MKIWHHILPMLLLATGIVSCNDETTDLTSGATGKIQLQLTTDNRLIKASSTSPEGDNEEMEELTGGVPEADTFTITLVSNDGNYNKTWESYSEFCSEESFPIGTYTLTAHYGDINQEGFEKPCYFGTTDVVISNDEPAETNLTAALCNSCISIEYTDAFKKYFTDYKATLSTKNNSGIEISKEETRMLYAAPGENKLTIEYKQAGGKAGKQQIPSFSTLARHHYKIKIDVNGGNVGETQLSIIFDDGLEKEDVIIDLSGEVPADVTIQ